MIRGPLITILEYRRSNSEVDTDSCLKLIRFRNLSPGFLTYVDPLVKRAFIKVYYYDNLASFSTIHGKEVIPNIRTADKARSPCYSKFSMNFFGIPIKLDRYIHQRASPNILPKKFASDVQYHCYIKVFNVEKINNQSNRSS